MSFVNIYSDAPPKQTLAKDVRAIDDFGPAHDNDDDFDDDVDFM